MANDNLDNLKNTLNSLNGLRTISNETSNSEFDKEQLKTISDTWKCSKEV